MVPARPTGRSLSRRARASIVGVSAAALALSACQPGVVLLASSGQEQGSATITTVDLADGKVPITQPIVLQATDGRFTDVVVKQGRNRIIKGEFSDDGTVWISTRKFLDYNSTYRIEATAVDSRGHVTDFSDSFKTVNPDGFLTATASPVDGADFGVGMPITVRFSQGVKDRAAVEQAIVVETPEPIMGAWYWTSDSEAIFRPKEYWPGNIDITVNMNLRGVKAGNGVYGADNTSVSYRTEDSVVMKVDAQTLQMRVFQNGKRTRTIPVTVGMDGYETLSGTKLIMTKERTRIMDNATAGVSEDDPDHYRVEVDYAMRLTWHGEFLHASPWAAGDWGVRRISHGCTSMSTENAAWLFSIAHIGDPVEITGTPLKQNPGNGITVWNISWKDWVANSASGANLTEAA